MVYEGKSKFVAVVTNNGKILREFKDENGNYAVKMPFGSEYSIRLKNLNSRRAVVTISIDGSDVFDGSKILVEANSTHDVEGYMEGSTIKNKFKFIEKTSEISDFRGDKIDDGIIRIEYQFEREVEEMPLIRRTYTEIISTPWRPYTREVSWNASDSTGSITRGIKKRGGEVSTQSMNYSCDDMSFSFCDESPTDSLADSTTDTKDGITVKGSSTNIQYKTAYVGPLESTKHVILLKTIGVEGEEKAAVIKAVTTKDKIQCPTCGKKHKFNTVYCSKCGTHIKK